VYGWNPNGKREKKKKKKKKRVSFTLKSSPIFTFVTVVGPWAL